MRPDSLEGDEWLFTEKNDFSACVNPPDDSI